MSIKAEDIMKTLDTRQINELESLTSMSGREEILIDDGTVTKKVTIDGLLGYFSSRFVGNEDNNIDITALNSASCIHIIKPGENVPSEERIKGHFYLKLSEQEVDKLYEAIAEDQEENKYYLETAKNKVSGLLFPDHYYINDEGYKYVKLLTVKIEDPEESAYISETFDLNLVNHVSDGYMYSKYNKIHFEMLYSKETKDIVSDSVILTANDMSDNTVIKKEVSRLICVRDSEICASVWLQMNNINTVLINRVFSLSLDKVPENKSHILTNYIATYVDNNSIKSDTELSNLEDTIGEKITETIDSKSNILNRIEAIENAIIKADLDIKFNAITFNTTNPIDTAEQQINATLIRALDAAYIFLKINDDGSVSVTKDGYYTLGLKQGFKVVSGESDLTLNVYVNGTKLEDLTSTVSLSDSFHLQYLTGQVTLRLHTSDVIRVTCQWSNSDIDIVNETALEVTKYMDTVEDLDFGSIGSELYPYVGIGKVGSARLLLGINNDGGEISVATYTMPYVDMAAVDKAKVKES